MPLIDSHLHLQDPALAADLPGVLQRAADAGVARMVCNGTHEGDWDAVAKLAGENSQVIACFGLHPWFVSGRSPQWLTLLERHLDSMPSGVGEIGLDRWLEPRDEAAQEQAFLVQLDLARRKNRPVVIHCLRSWGWLSDILSHEDPLPAGMLIHAYGGPVELIQPLAQRGAYFSFAGNAFEERRLRVRQAIAAVPLDRLLIESDAPDMLPPEAFRRHVVTGADGKIHNEPANLPEILAGVAKLRGQSAGSLSEVIWENARRLLTPICGQTL